MDELHITVCPLIFGGKKAPTLTGIADDFLPASTQLRLVEMVPLNGECFTPLAGDAERFSSLKLQLQVSMQARLEAGASSYGRCSPKPLDAPRTL